MDPPFGRLFKAGRGAGVISKELHSLERPSHRFAPRKIDRLFSARSLITLLAFGLYAFLPTKNYYWDGIGFAQSIEDATGVGAFLHPNHLIYTAIGWTAYRAVGLFYAAARALYVLQALNAIFGAATVYCLFGIVKRISGSNSTAAWLAAGVAFSGTWWRFTSDADAYVVAVFFLTLCASALLKSERPSPVIVGLLHASAVLMHELSLVFLPVAAYALWFRVGAAGPETKRGRVSDVLTYSGVLGACVLIPYFLAYRVVSGKWSASGMAHWMLQHSPDSAFSFQLGRNIVVSLRSWCQLIFSGRPSAVRYGSPLTILLLGMAAGALIMLVRAIFQRQRAHGISLAVWNPRTLRLAVIWVAVYALFLFVWLPHNTFYKLFALPGLCLVVASCAKPGSRISASSPLALSVILMALCNLTFAVIPYSDPRANEAVDFALRLGNRLEPGAIVQYRSFSPDDWLARYFAPRTSWRPAESPATIDDELRRGKAVWLETSAADEIRNADPAWLDARADKNGCISLVNSRHRIVFTRLRPAGAVSSGG